MSYIIIVSSLPVHTLLRILPLAGQPVCILWMFEELFSDSSSHCVCGIIHELSLCYPLAGMTNSFCSVNVNCVSPLHSCVCTLVLNTACQRLFPLYGSLCSQHCYWVVSLQVMFWGQTVFLFCERTECVIFLHIIYYMSSCIFAFIWVLCSGGWFSCSVYWTTLFAWQPTWHNPMASFLG